MPPVIQCNISSAFQLRHGMIGKSQGLYILANEGQTTFDSVVTVSNFFVRDSGMMPREQKPTLLWQKVCKIEGHEIALSWGFQTKRSDKQIDNSNYGCMHKAIKTSINNFYLALLTL